MLLIMIAAILGIDEAVPEDPRVEMMRDTNAPFAMTPFESRDAWERYAGELRRILQVSCGMYPSFDKTPIDVRREPVATHADYRVERVEFEAVPGLYVTGNLYLPPGDGPFPAVLCPHGHWDNGRFEDSDRGSVPARCITFARMGMVAFSWDMAGCNDSHPMTHAWAHAANALPPRERRVEALWGFHPFSVQLVSSIRALDMIEALPQVDPARIACVGASGGGTQTFALTAMDPRIAVSVPVNMISHKMQGGCPCENAPLLRLRASNMEIGALAAPRPMLMVWATGDWTADTTSIEYPAIKGIYAFYNAENALEQHGEDAGHNFNRQSREAVYPFLARILLGQTIDTFPEPPYQIEPIDTLRLYPDGQAPTDNGYQPLLTHWKERTSAQVRAILPANTEGVASFADHMRPALRDCIGLSSVTPQPPLVIERTPAGADPIAGERITMRREGIPGSVEGRLFHNGAPRAVALLLHDEGMLAITEPNGPLRPLADQLLSHSIAVMALSPFSNQRAAQRPDQPFRDTFEPTDTAWRVQDVMTALAFLRETYPGQDLRLFGMGDAGVIALLASAAEGTVGCTVVDLGNFDPNNDDHWVDRAYLPSIRALGGIETIAALVAPNALALAMDSVTPDKTPPLIHTLGPLFPRGQVEITPTMDQPEAWAETLEQGAIDATS